MAFTMQEVQTREDFDAVIDVVWVAMQEPLRPSFHWLHPVHGYTEDDIVAAMKRDADRTWQSHSKNPASHWFTVTDTASGEVAGTVNWLVFTSDPYPQGPVKLKCTWFPESETQDFVTEFINQLYYPRMNWMNRPFIAINAMAVKPAMRKRGVGSLMMGWGLQKAEELNLECWVEASAMGRDLYEKYEFRFLLTVLLDMHRKNASPTWNKLQKQFVPSSITLLWRPAPKDLRAGSSRSFWDVTAQHARNKS